MLLLYLRSHGCCSERILYLHSTMLLLYPLSCIIICDANIIYIPLCFYFISSSIAAQICASASFTFHYASTLSKESWTWSHSAYNLHSTMLLLYRARIVVYVWCSIVFTFHYASTLSHLTAITSFLFMPIYIPLCFYFIRCCFRYWFLLKLHLHSTMLLLYPVRVIIVLSRILATFRSCYIQLN